MNIVKHSLAQWRTFVKCLTRFCNTLQSYPICERIKPLHDLLTHNGIAEGLANAKIAAIYHSETGNTWQIAEVISEGCRKVEGVEARCMAVGEVDKDYAMESSALIFGSATYEGTCSWRSKNTLIFKLPAKAPEATPEHRY